MSDIIRQFNRMPINGGALIQKALTSATNVGESLIPEKLEQVITNTILRLSPELAMVEPEFDNQKFHEYNQVDALPSAGGAMGESAVTPTRNSTFSRKSVELKIIRRKGAVTNFMQDTSQKFVDASSAEMENHILAHAYDLATYILYGNKTADAYAFDGIDALITTNRENNVQAGVVPTTLSFLDTLIDQNTEKQGASHRKAFIMSARMLSKISQLLTNVRLNQGLNAGGLSQVDVNGGWRLNAYRDIPIIVSNAMRPTGTMTTLTATKSATGGALANGTYYFRIAPVTYDGEQTASAEASATPDAGTSVQAVDLSWTAYTGALFYKIYGGTVSGTLTLKAVVSAFSYDGNGTITGNTTSKQIDSMTAESSATNQSSDTPLVGSGGIPSESVIFWDLDKYQGLGKLPYTNTAGSKFNGLVTINPLAITDDDLPFLIKSYCALCPSYEATSSIVRNLRIA